MGYKEFSQYFIWRVQRLLKPEGEIGLLVSNGVLLKHQDKSVAFRQEWLKQNKIRLICSFAHVRHSFFKAAIAPFIAVFFSPAREEDALRSVLTYVSVKRNSMTTELQAVIFDKTDVRKARQNEFLIHDWLWKAYMWGSFEDIELIEELRSLYRPLREIIDESGSGYEVKKKGRTKRTDEINVSQELPKGSLKTRKSVLESLIPLESRAVARLGNVNIYEGHRILVKRGVSRSDNNGEIQAVLVDEPFAFKNDIFGFKVDSLSGNKRKILLGILLSSLTKYYHFLTCSTWGFWHDEIHLNEHLDLPIVFPDSPELTRRIVESVDRLENQDSYSPLFNWKAEDHYSAQDDLDTAIFELYGLSEAQKSLVRDLCNITLEFFYRGMNAQAIQPPSEIQLNEYVETFLKAWRDRLQPVGKALETNVFAPKNSLLYGMSFELKNLGQAKELAYITDDAEWQEWLNRLGGALRQKLGDNIYIDKVLKELTDSSMLIIKRAELRLWTKSQARQDAGELLTEVFKQEWQRGERVA